MRIVRHFGKKSMNWIALEDLETLEEIKTLSQEKEVVIFKHSTRCFISKMVKSKFEKKVRKAATEAVDFYYLDLIKYRPISNEISNIFNVPHQSPQALVIKNGEVVSHASHYDIVSNIEI